MELNGGAVTGVGNQGDGERQMQLPPQKIDQLFAFLAVDAEGNEGVMAYFDPPNNRWMPLVGADLAKVDQIRPIVEEMAKAANIKATLAVFSERKNMEVIG